MTKQEAIELLSEIRSGYNCFDESERPFYEALSEAIEVLSAQPEQHWIPCSKGLPKKMADIRSHGMTMLRIQNL